MIGKMRVLLTQIDGKLPNLALMRLSTYYKSLGADVHFTRVVRAPTKRKSPPHFDRVYASSLFKFSSKKIERLKMSYPDAIIGGTGAERQSRLIIPEVYDYSLYPEFEDSIGFSQRGCRLKCVFCMVPETEGPMKNNMTINEIWRGGKHPKRIVLLDNDFFGQEFWREKSNEIIDGKFKVNFTQGINIRLINDEQADYLSRMKYYNTKFSSRRVYTAFDNMRDKKIFLRGIQSMIRAKIKPFHIMVYMLVGHWPGETFDEIIVRYNIMNDMGLLPYPMVWDKTDFRLRAFQRWIVRGYYRFIPWANFEWPNKKDYPKHSETPRMKDWQKKEEEERKRQMARSKLAGAGVSTNKG